MKRRNFSSMAVWAASSAGAMAMGRAKPVGKQYLELRRYLLDSAEKQQVLEAFMRDVEIPALNQLGIGPVGVFKELEGKDLSLYVLVPYNSLEAFASLSDRLEADKEYMEKGAAVLTAGKKNPSFLRIESLLMESFDRIPRLVVPSKKEGRIYELRQYESACFTDAKNKVEMFNTGGEITLFEETGLAPVFFGESLSGDRLPNLTYMISFDDMAARDASWKAFLQHPEWKRIKEIPKYKGTVSKITKTYLTAASCSQI